MSPPPSYEEAIGSKKPKYRRVNRNQLSLFYISDQIVDFYRKSDLILPDSFKLVTEKRIATAGIMAALISRYIKLKCPANGRRYLPADRMKIYFRDTHYKFKNEIINEIPITFIDFYSKREYYLKRFNDGDLSFFELIKDRKDKKDNEYIYNEEGLKFVSIIILNNMYKIPILLLNEQRKKELEMEEIYAMADDLQFFLVNNRI